MYTYTDKQQDGIKKMIKGFLKYYKTSNYDESKRGFYREILQSLIGETNKRTYTTKTQDHLNWIRSIYINDYRKNFEAGKINISSKGIGSIIKNGNNSN